VNIKHAEGIASRLYKIDVDGLRGALQIADDVEEIDEKSFIELLVSKQSEVIKDRFDRGYQSAESKVLKTLEKEIRSEFGIDSAELKGIDLVRAAIDSAKEEAGKSAPKSKLTDDDVKKHPLYLELEKAKKTEVETLKTEYETKIKAELDSREYERLLGTVDQEADKIFATLGTPVLPEDATIAQKHKQKLLFDELRGFKFQKNGDDVIVLKQDGTRVEDKAGNAKSLKDIVAEIAKGNFVFKASEDRKSAGNGGDSGSNGSNGGTKKFTGNAPKTAQEYVGLLTSNELSIEQKSEIKEVYGPGFAN
jgi:hypothetical protein